MWGRLALALSLAVIAGVSGCASGPTPYAPAVGAGPGYVPEAIGDARSFEPTASRGYAHSLFGRITSVEWAVSSPLRHAHHYEARLEITLLRGPLTPEHNLFDAREVLAVLWEKVAPLARGRAQ